jgi:hypothetical protein
VAWKIYLGYNGNPGDSVVALAPYQSTRTYGLAYAGTWLEVYQGADDQTPYTALMMSFSGDDTGNEIAPRASVSNLARGWWEFKMEATGLQISTYYRVPGTTSWTLIGPTTQEDGFTPAWVGVALGSRGFADDIGFNADGPPSGTLKGHVNLEDYTPSSPTPMAVGIDLIKDDVIARSETVILDADGKYSIAGIPSDTYSVGFKAAQFLRKVALEVTVPVGGDGICDVSLVNGDLNGDNSVGFADFNILRKNWGAEGD